MSLKNKKRLTPEYFVGLGGNYYVACDNKTMLEAICLIIHKSMSSIYYSKTYECYVIRAKSINHKTNIKNVFGKYML